MYNTCERRWTKNPSQKDVEQIFSEACENGLAAARTVLDCTALRWISTATASRR